MENVNRSKNRKISNSVFSSVDTQRIEYNNICVVRPSGIAKYENGL